MVPTGLKSLAFCTNQAQGEMISGGGRMKIFRQTGDIFVPKMLQVEYFKFI